MFTGIVEEIGTLKKIVWGAHSAVLSIRSGGGQHCGKWNLSDGHKSFTLWIYGRCDA